MNLALSNITYQTVSSMITFFLAMCLHPKIQKKGQEEIDSILGGEQLPSITDRHPLPYVEAIMKEVLRWIPVAPLGQFCVSMPFD